MHISVGRSVGSQMSLRTIAPTTATGVIYESRLTALCARASAGAVTRFDLI